MRGAERPPRPPISAPICPPIWLPVLALAAALLTQGVAGRPAPPVFRPEIEGVVAAGLLAAAGWRAPLAAGLGGFPLGWFPDATQRWFVVGSGCLCILLWPPLARAAWMGWSSADAARDVAPLLFLFLPLALVPSLRPAGKTAVVALTAALMLEGLFYALRWWRHADWGFGALGARTLADGGGYLLNAPSVLFAAIAWPLAALHCFEKGGVLRFAAGFGALAAGATCVAGLLGAAHRLAFGLILLAAATALWTRARRIPWLIPALVVAAVAVAAAEGDRLAGALFHIVEKTRVTGGNARVEEAAAALAMAGETLESLLFGAGWGALIDNPAVGGWRVSYTHTFLTYLLVKAGLVGLAAGTIWLGVFLRPAAALWRHDPAWALAMLSPLFVSFTVHTSYKYLDTGVMLTLLWIAAERTEKINGK